MTIQSTCTSKAVADLATGQRVQEGVLVTPEGEACWELGDDCELMRLGQLMSEEGTHVQKVEWTLLLASTETYSDRALHVVKVDAGFQAIHFHILPNGEEHVDTFGVAMSSVEMAKAQFPANLLEQAVVQGKGQGAVDARYLVKDLDAGNDQWAVYDKQTNTYWSHDGWQQPDAGLASVLDHSEAQEMVTKLNIPGQGVANCVEHASTGKSGVFAAKFRPLGVS